MYKLLTNQERVKFLREASDVQRLHTIRTIGEYSNGQHSFNTLAILRLLRPDASTSLIWAIVEHDIPERLIGDVPSPALHHVYGLSKLAVSEAEGDIISEVLGIDSLSELSEDDYKWLKGLDLLELYLYCRDQLSMGNRNLEQIKIRIEETFKMNAKNYPEEILDLFYECKNCDWVHLPDLVC